jgi:hypothetical protein
MIRCFVDAQVFSEKTDNLSICKYFVQLHVSEITTIPTWKTAHNLVNLQIFCAFASFLCICKFFAKNQQVCEFSLLSRFKYNFTRLVSHEKRKFISAEVIF